MRLGATGADDPLARIRNLAVALAALGAAATAATGRFQGAVALTLGAAVAIVSFLWLVQSARRVMDPVALRDGNVQRPAWKVGTKAVLRYVVIGGSLFGVVGVLPAEAPFVAAGATSVVLAITVDALAGRRSGQAGPGAG